MINVRRLLGCTAVCGTLGMLAGPASAQAPSEPIYVIPKIDVIGVSPVQGSGIERDRVPANVITIDRNAAKQGDPLSLGDVLDQRLGSASRSDSQNNPFQPSINVRGFTASPILGEPQGLAIYQNGVRINEPFGDLVQWDLVPSFAINRLQVIQGTNPIFGLNALGGAVSAEMNNGFNFKGGRFSLEGGSFGRFQGTAEYGAQRGNLGYYVGVNGIREDGWRKQSPSKLFQSYADVALRKDDYEIGAGLTIVRSDLTGNGPLPVELYAQDRSAFFTSPDITRNTLVQLALRGSYELSDTWSLQSNGYYRYNQRNTINGDATGNGNCTGANGTPGFLCAEPGADEEQLEDIFGNPINSALIGDGAMNRQKTITNGIGGSLQATHEGQLFGFRNSFIVGGAFDLGWSKFRSASELSVLNPDRSVSGVGVQLGTEDFNTQVDARNQYFGLYATDTFGVTDRLNVTAAVRFNLANVELVDRFGTALNGKHTFSRANPSVGMTYQLLDNVNFYGGYSEANRIPTPAELSCADPTQPCRFPNAFLSDPPLEQVVSRSFEVGLRGRRAFNDGSGGYAWSLSAFTTTNSNDIIFVSAGPVVGSGFFTNAGKTRRRGIEASLSGNSGRWSWYGNYSLIEATFQSPLTILSPDNPSADGNGNIFVNPGDRIPNIPLHTAKLGVGYNITDSWAVAVESVITSSRFFRGDENNSQKPLDGFAVFNLSSTYRVTDWMQAKLRINNIFNTRYETFGLYADATDVFPGFTTNRFVGPGAPLGAWVGLSATF